ncbi:MAG: pyridoxamine 5'-phosphate oxidase family protein [Tannerella sp.]|jgi:uncharacterized pyridoxamine 5'-phosphate oxidase family protein|nr:pyridoxamine 5'-phosphate oxidase family protein [Tannerella sp.]
MDNILRFLDACGVFYLATCEGGQAKVRPMNFARNVNGKLGFYTSKQKDLYRQLARNPLAEIAAAGPGGWIRIRGRMSFCDAPEVFALWAAEAEFFRFADADRVACCFDGAVAEFMPGYQVPLPDFVATWERAVMPEGEVRYTGAL